MLNLVFAAPHRASGWTRPSGRRRSSAIAELKTEEFEPTEDEGGDQRGRRPFDENTFSDDGRIAYAEAQFDRIIFEEDREAVVAVQDAVRAAVEPAGVTVEFNGDAEFRRSSRERQELLGPARCPPRPGRLPHARRDGDADRARARRGHDRVPAAVHPTGLTDINTITPLLVSMIGIGVGIDYSLFIVTRFRQLLHEGLSPADAATEAGATAGRAVLFAGLTVAISVTGLAFFGLDFVTKLGIGSALGVLTTVLIANSL